MTPKRFLRASDVAAAKAAREIAGFKSDEHRVYLMHLARVAFPNSGQFVESVRRQMRSRSNAEKERPDYLA